MKILTGKIKTIECQMVRSIQGDIILVTALHKGKTIYDGYFTGTVIHVGKNSDFLYGETKKFHTASFFAMPYRQNVLLKQKNNGNK